MPALRPALIPSFVLLAGTLACGGDDDARVADTAAAASAAEDSVRRAVIGEASHYDFDTLMAPTLVADSVLPDRGATPPQIQFQRAILSDTLPHVPGNRIVMRITAPAAWAPLGIPAGQSLVYRDSLPGQALPRYLLVPLDAAAPVQWWRTNGTMYSASGDPPRFLASSRALGFCETGCQNGHCTADESRARFRAADSIQPFHQ
jgi:hypothetical protein